MDDRIARQIQGQDLTDLNLRTCAWLNLQVNTALFMEDRQKVKMFWPLQNNMGQIQKRTRGKPAVIRFARFSQQKTPEKFYGTLLKLYLPYRRDEQLKSTRFPYI